MDDYERLIEEFVMWGIHQPITEVGLSKAGIAALFPVGRSKHYKEPGPEFVKLLSEKIDGIIKQQINDETSKKVFQFGNMTILRSFHSKWYEKESPMRKLITFVRKCAECRRLINEAEKKAYMAKVKEDRVKKEMDNLLKTREAKARHRVDTTRRALGKIEHFATAS